MIAAINALRNGIAHSLDEDHRGKQFQRMRELYLRELDNPELRKKDEAVQEDHLLFLMAYAMCDGYLKAVEKDAEMAGTFFRQMIERMRKELYTQPETK